MAVAPILPTDFPTLPVEFLRAVNDRFRELSTTVAATTAAGSIAGLFFLHKNRPDANGTPVGTFGYETDTGDFLQVETVGSSQTWVHIAPLHLDSGATPADSQLVLQANDLGALSLLAYAADNVDIGLDAEWSASGWVARNAGICVIQKNGGLLNIYGSTGNTVGSAPTLTLRATISLSTGDINASTGVYKKGGTQVLGARQTGWSAPTATLSRAALANGDTAAKVLQTVAALVTDLMTSGVIGT